MSTPAPGSDRLDELVEIARARALTRAEGDELGLRIRTFREEIARTEKLGEFQAGRLAGLADARRILRWAQKRPRPYERRRDKPGVEYVDRFYDACEKLDKAVEEARPAAGQCGGETKAAASEGEAPHG
jgi:hypothetical protein